MSDETNTDFPSSADRAVDSLHRIDEKVNRLREDRLNDPDSLGDKLIKSAVPALAGLVAGKAFQMIWDKGTSKRNLRKGLAADAPQSLAMSLTFAAVSAALGAVVSQLSDRGWGGAPAPRRRAPSRYPPVWLWVSVGCRVTHRWNFAKDPSVKRQEPAVQLSSATQYRHFTVR